MHDLRRLRRGLLPWAVGCFGILGFGAAPAWAVPYSLLTTIPITSASGAAQGLSSFDISYFDGTTQNYYLADRTNAAVDVLSAATNTFVTQVGAGTFSGITGSDFSQAGPNGVLVSDGQLFAGNGDSTVHTFGVSGATYTPATTISTGAPAALRADEMAYDPTDNVLVVANDAASPSPYLTLVNATSHATIATITLNGSGGTPNATSGLEQTVWDPNTKVFYTSVPQIGGGTDPGGILEFDATGKIIKTFSLAGFGISSCSPAGLVQGSGNQLLIGCGGAGSKTIIFDPTANGGAGGIVSTFSFSGADQVAYDPSSSLFFVTDSAAGQLGIINGATDTFLGSVTTGVGSHSVAVDPVSNEVFVPIAAGRGTCVGSSGCVAVFAPTVPEPGSLSLLAVGLLGLAGVTGLARRRRRATRH